MVAMDTLLRPIEWDQIPSPVILPGDSRFAFRDPTLHYYQGVFRIFVSITTRNDDGILSFEIAVIQSRDLVHWSDPKVITPSDNRSNFTAVGTVVRFKNRWIACLSSYPTPPLGRTADARAWTMASDDLISWSEPELLRLKGPDVPEEKMGRIIDPCLFLDKDDPQKWWCAYKQGGILIQHPRGLAFGGFDFPPTARLLQSMNLSYSYDLADWTFFGKADAEENYCMLVENNQYVLVHAPGNGIGVKCSTDLINWQDLGLYTLGQRHWPWAQGRITAGHILDLRNEPGIGKYLMVFHGCSIEGKIASSAHGGASLGIAWSDDMQRWHWPEEGSDE